MLSALFAGLAFALVVPNEKPKMVCKKPKMLVQVMLFFTARHLQEKREKGKRRESHLGVSMMKQ